MSEQLFAQKFVSVVVPRPLERRYSYLLPEGLPQGSEESLAVGSWVRVPFGRGETHAFVVEPPKPLAELPPEVPRDKLKTVLEVGAGGSAFTRDVWELCLWAQDYYLTPLGEVLNAAAPGASLGLKSAKRQARALTELTTPHEPVTLTEEQQSAVMLIQSLPAGAATLLQGVTGSGKTEVYLELAREVLKQGKGALFLVPEIALTPQLRERFERRLGFPVALWHSAVADGQRRDLAWALRSGELRAVVGARSGVFAPVRDLGLIVVDEEHDGSYKQEDRFRYHARDLAIVRGRIAKAHVVLGSATPSLESRERARDGKYSFCELTARVNRKGVEIAPPVIDLVDLRTEPMVGAARSWLAERTLTELRETLTRGEQAMVFLNRRGFAWFLVCEACGESFECPRCSITLSVHKRDGELRCHQCGHRESEPEICRQCQGSDLSPVGAGTESLEEDLAKLLPEARIARMDRDQITSATRLEKIVEDFRTGVTNLMIGTQMLAKGHDFPLVTRVVVVLADSLFRFPEFRATERGYQTLLQVSGRSGRAGKTGRVLIQTFRPEHPALATLIGKMSEASLLENERALRRELGYPPFRRLARLRIESPKAEQARDWAEYLGQVASRCAGVELLGPSPALIERVADQYRWDLLLKSADAAALHRAARETLQAHRKRASQDPSGKTCELWIDVDPQA